MPAAGQGAGREGKAGRMDREQKKREEGDRAIPVFAEDPALAGEAKDLAGRLGLPPAGDREEAGQAGLWLALTSDGLCLTDGDLVLKGDYGRLLKRLRPSELGRELLVRAARIREAEGPLRAVDCTAGLGEDSLLLAAAGFEVTLFEYNPVIFALLEDTISRARRDPALSLTASRMRPIRGDAAEGLAGLGFRPDVIYLDPMFPEKRGNSATRKKLQLFRRLEEPCSKEEDLLEAALLAGPSRIVIKRPLKGPFLAGKKPGFSIRGKTVRYDCLVLSVKQENDC